MTRILLVQGANLSRIGKRNPEHYGHLPPAEFDAALAAYRWPGNVRELRNLIERIVIMNPQAKIERKHLPAFVFRADGKSEGARAAAEPTTLQQARAAYERDFIAKRLEENRGNVARTAQELGLERSHLYRKMKALGISTS